MVRWLAPTTLCIQVLSIALRLSTRSAGYLPKRFRGWRACSLSAGGLPTDPSAFGGPIGCPSPDARHSESAVAVPPLSTRAGWRKRLAHAAVSHPITATPPKCEPGVLRDSLDDPTGTPAFEHLSTSPSVRHHTLADTH